MFFEITEPEYERLPFLLTTVGSQENQPALDRPGGLRFHQFLFVTHGAGSFRVDGQSFRLSAGQALFAQQGTPLFYEPARRDFGTAWLTFRGSGAESLLQYFQIPSYKTFAAGEHIVGSLKQFEQSAQQKTVLARSADGYSLVLNLLDQLTLPTSAWSQKIRKVNNYLEAHFNQNLSLDELAAFSGTDRYSLCRQYRQLTGVTVMNALRTLRIAKAKEMLLSDYLSVNQIAHSCGFESPSYFVQVFKSVMGMTPGEYRSFSRQR